MIKYRLALTVRLEQVDPYPTYSPTPMQLTEDLIFEAPSFLAIASILGKFHELSESIRQDAPSDT